MRKVSVLSIIALQMSSFIRRPNFCLDYADVTIASDCNPNANGVKAQLLFNSRKNITAYPTQATPTTPSDLGKLTGAYTVAASKPFKKLEVDHEVSDYKCEGAAPGVGPFKVSAKLFIKGTRDEVAGTCAQLQYDNPVFVITLSDGVRVPIGNADFPAKVNAKFDSKTTQATDPRGWELEIMSSSVYPERLATAVTVPLT